MAVRHIREAFGYLRSEGYVSDAQVLRQCAASYHRNAETRTKLQKRLELNAALKKMARNGTLSVEDDLGRVYQIEPTGAALGALTRRLKRTRPEVTLTVSQEQSPILALPFAEVA
jgi:hypothetical protein